MLTDWVLMQRLAGELRERLRAARVEDAGLLPDGRTAILFRLRGARSLLAIDLFSSPPIVTLEDGELGIGDEPGFVRALARTLRAMVLEDVAARRDDRLLRLSFASRSRFGVGDRLELYAELVPRFGNLVLVKGGTVVAAYKEFSPSENPRRAVQAGSPYVLPPLPARSRALGEEASDAAPLFVYRRSDELLQAYVAPLQGFEEATVTRENSLLQIFSELRAQQSTHASNERSGARRRVLLKQLASRERGVRSELASLAQKRRSADDREALRTQGVAIFATLHELEESERDDAKELAARLFAQYKKLGKAIPHVEARERALRAALEAIETLRWEVERAGDDDVEAVESAVEQLGRTHSKPAPLRAPKRKRALLEFRTSQGSRILVGRSPIENAELTFRLARPTDLWFHAQRIPGAHVILARDDRAAPPEEDLQVAAALAALHSRAKGSGSVPVDYTLRKHVRKQRAAPPGLVWYTNAKTIVAEPKSLDSLS